MSRVALTMALALITTAIGAALPVVFGTGAWPLTPAVVLVAYAALTVPPLEAAVTAALVGLIVDALAGAPLGVSSFALVVTLLLSRLVVSLVPTARGPLALAFVFGFGFVHALLAQTLLAVFGQNRVVDVLVVVGVGVLDAVAALVLFPLIRGALVVLRLEDKSATFKERLQAR